MHHARTAGDDPPETPRAQPAPGTPGAHGAAPESPEDEGYAPEFLDLERELAVFLRRARASSLEVAREVHPELEPSAYGLLVRLAEAGAQRATALATYFGIGKATMSRQVAALEGLGLITRTPDPDDGRASLLQISPEGYERFQRVRRARRARYQRKLSAWDRDEIAELARLLHRFNGLQDVEG